jgi:MOSC domain-containing protein YiiM
MGIVERIFTAATRGAPMVSRDRVMALMNEGLVGDRYAQAATRRGPNYQLTLIEAENVEAFAHSIDGAFKADMPRRNIVTRGVSLNDLVGRQFGIGGAKLEGIELCEPCSLFAKRTRREVLTHFRNRGGLRARIVGGGEIHVGDAVIVIE